MNTNAAAVFVSSISALIALGALLFSIIQGKRREKKLEKRNEILEVKNDFLENRRYIDMLNKITEIMINIDDQIIQNPELDCLFEKNGRVNNDPTNEIRHKYFGYKMLDLMQVIYITFYDSTRDYRTYKDCLEYLKKYDKHVELHVKS
jgi:Co/Zn/Cd efflux system component